MASRSYERAADHADRTYTGHPSCTICKVDYLGEGTCGACRMVANLCADSLLVLKRNSDLYRAAQEALTFIERVPDSLFDSGDKAAVEDDLRVVTPAGLMPRCTESNPTLGRCDRLEGHASAHHVYGWWWKEDDVREDITETHDGT